MTVLSEWSDKDVLLLFVTDQCTKNSFTFINTQDILYFTIKEEKQLGSVQFTSSYLFKTLNIPISFLFFQLKLYMHRLNMYAYIFKIIDKTVVFNLESSIGNGLTPPAFPTWIPTWFRSRTQICYLHLPHIWQGTN